MIEPGLEATAEVEVTESLTAERLGSGDVPVLATPAVVAVVERAAVAAVAPGLDPGATTVGARIELDHLRPTPVGGHARATARLDQVEGRKLRFRFEVSDDAGTVAQGIHERVVVRRDRFMRDAAGRRTADSEGPRPGEGQRAEDGDGQRTGDGDGGPGG